MNYFYIYLMQSCAFYLSIVIIYYQYAHTWDYYCIPKVNMIKSGFLYERHDIPINNLIYVILIKCKNKKTSR